MSRDSVDVSVTAYLDLGGDDAEIVADEVDDSGVFGALLGIGKEFFGCVGSGIEGRSFHRVRGYFSIVDADKGFRGKANEAVAPPKTIAGSGVLENL